MSCSPSAPSSGRPTTTPMSRRLLHPGSPHPHRDRPGADDAQPRCPTSRSLGDAAATVDGAARAHLGDTARRGDGAGARRARPPRGARRALLADAAAGRVPERSPRRASRRRHRRRFHAGRLCRQSLLRRRVAGRLVQLRDRLRHARLRPPRLDRREARRAGAPGRLPRRRRRAAVHARRARLGRSTPKRRSSCSSGTIAATARSRNTFWSAASSRSAAIPRRPISSPSPGPTACTPSASTSRDALARAPQGCRRRATSRR